MIIKDNATALGLHAYLELVAQVEVLEGDLQVHPDIIPLGRLLFFLSHPPKAAKATKAAATKESAPQTGPLEGCGGMQYRIFS